MRQYKQTFKNTEHRKVQAIDFDTFYDDASNDWGQKTRRLNWRRWRKVMRHHKHHA